MIIFKNFLLLLFFFNFMKLKKIIKKTRKLVKKFLKRYSPEFIKDFFEEAEDFFEEIIEIFFKKKKIKFKKLKKIKLYGTFMSVRPAYVFAERLDSFLKMIFGFSILVSGIITYFWGFTRLSDLLDTLIKSFFGRILIIIIGFSYFILGFWKVANIRS
jgi:hypothetical protein